MKQCSRCGEKLPRELFHKKKTAKDGLRSCCKRCSTADTRRWRQENLSRSRQLARAQIKRYIARNPRYPLRSNLRRHYGIGLKEYDEMVLASGGRCDICNKAMMSEKEPAVDHCHKTGKIRGLLCTSCNTSLHALETHGPRWVASAFTYLGGICE